MKTFENLFNIFTIRKVKNIYTYHFAHLFGGLSDLGIRPVFVMLADDKINVGLGNTLKYNEEYFSRDNVINNVITSCSY